MCRIAGTLHKDLAKFPIDGEAIVAAMGDSMRRGGPDGFGTLRSGPVVLTHRRLSIIAPGPDGAQPFADDVAVLSYNGEVYNYQQLRDELAAEYTFRGASDTEVVFAALRRWGKEALSRLEGMWALAYWDGASEELLLARDGRGIKPLYYAELPDQLLFASELKGIMAHPACPRAIDPAATRAFLRRGYIPSPRTIYAGVKKLNAGEWLAVAATTGTISRGRHHEDLSEKAEERVGGCLKAQLREHLQRSCEQRMVADVPVGVLLSGGVDSTLIAATLQAKREVPVATYTMGFEAAGFNEAPRAAAIARHLGTDHQAFYCTSSDFLTALPDVRRTFCEPFGDASGIAAWLLSRGVSQQLKCCLSGEGGDELFGGYNKYRATLAFDRTLRRLPLPVRKWSSLALRSVGPGRISRLLASFGDQTPNREDQLYKFTNSLGSASTQAFFREASSYAGQEVLLRLGLSEDTAIAEEGTGELLRDMSVTDLTSFLVDDLLVKTDRASMDHGLEVRLPFLDDELVNFGLDLPPHKKIAGKKSKVLLRQLLADFLPEKLTGAPKRGFVIPLDQWLRSELVNELDDMANDRGFAAAFGFSVTGLSALIADYLDGRTYVNAYPVWFLYVLHGWFQTWHR